MARRFQFEYPEWFPGSARAEVDRVLLVHEELFVVAYVSPDGGAVGPHEADRAAIERFPVLARAEVDQALLDRGELFGVTYVSPDRGAVGPDEADRAAIAHVVAVFQVIVREACQAARPFGWSAERLRTTTEDLFAQLVEHTYQDKYSKRDWSGAQPGRAVTREDFAARVHGELTQSLGWTLLQATIRKLSVGGHTEPAGPAGSATPSQAASPPRPAATVPPPRPLRSANERRAAVNAFLAAANASRPFARRLRRTHFWRAMGYKAAKQFELWQAAAPSASEECDKNCRKLLDESPEEFIATIKKRGLVV